VSLPVAVVVVSVVSVVNPVSALELPPSSEQ
jgi:hypothetical protein